jgi:DNA-binding transcriptional LysR family regulator
MRNLDIGVLRTLIAIDQYGSFARAAERIGRSESAVSLQLKRLEELIGVPLFHRVGRKMALTDAGQTLLSYARQLIEINDRALTVSSGREAEGVVRLGVPADFAETWLPPALARFARLHPGIRVETTVGRSPALMAALSDGGLDLAVSFAAGEASAARWSVTLPMTWIGPRGFKRAPGEPVRLAVFDPPCLFRSAATAALDADDIPWTIAFTSPSLAGLWAAVNAGLGVTVRTPAGLPPHLWTLRSPTPLPSLPNVTLALFNRREGDPSAAALRLSEVLSESIESTLGGAI